MTHTADIIILFRKFQLLSIMKSWLHERRRAAGKMHNDTATRQAGIVLIVR